MNIKLLKQSDDGPTQLEDFVWTMRGYVNVSLRKVIDLGERTETTM